ncbi:major capsid protein [Microviridae sp.]|nr:major capsid protein [Microviridae sp.]
MNKNIFQSILVNKPKLNKFDLSHEKKLSLKMGKLYPMLLQEIIPGDRFRVSSEIMLRLAPMISPVMHRVHVYTHYFFVPNRLVWNEWEDFITGGEEGDAEPAYPKIVINNTTKSAFTKGRVPDYMSIPTLDSADTIETAKISALPFRAYQLIYNEYFRDQNLQDKIPFDLGGGDITDQSDVETLTDLRDRAWEKDYFTSALPWAQRGGEATIPIGQVQPNYKTPSEVKTVIGTAQANATLASDGTGDLAEEGNLANQLVLDNLLPMDVDAVAINDLRKANRLQEWLEKSARGGSRYIEQILSHFGVRSSDARLQRPEYLGGGKQPVVISEVLNTTGIVNETEGGNVQGDMAGHGISVGRSNRFKKSFEEHGYVIGIMSVLPRTTYQNGIERHFNKFDKFDYFWPEFAHLGEQEIKNKEIYLDYLDASENETTWGYQQRYAEYKYNQSSVHGDFRDNLAFWHMGRQFDELPELSEDFVKSDPTKRIFAVTADDVDTLYCQIYNKIDALRPMPYFSIPTL